FRGWGIRVAIPILAMVVFGVAVVVIAGANSGHGGPAPSAASLGFPPATLAGSDFTAAGSGRGITQTLGRVASVGHEIVAVGSQAGTRIPRAQFFVSDDGRTWTMGTVRDAAGGVPPPGHGAIFVAGAQGAWVALGPGSIWTSTDGRTWTLAPGNGMPLRPGDQVNAVTRTAHGFIAVGASVPGGDQARSTPLIFLSASGTSWERLDAARLRLPAGNGHAVDIRSVAAAGKLILIAGDAVTSKVTGKPKRTVPVQVGVAWLSADGGATWAPVTGTATGHGAQPQVAGVAAVGRGFVMLRPATVARRPAVDVFSSPNGLAWTFRATLGAPAGFTALMASGGPDGAVLAGETGVTGQAGRNLTAFASADGRTWHQARPFGTAAAQHVSGVALAPGGAVVAAGISDAPDARQPVITLTGVNAAARQVDIAKIPGAVEPQVTVNSIAAQDSTQLAVGSANGYPAAWTSGNGGSSWTRAVGALPAVFSRPGSQRLTSVTHGPMGWLAVGDVTASAPEHPVVVVSADGTGWQAADGERVFGASGLFTEQAAANTGGYVVVGHQNIKRVQNGRVVAARTEAAVWWSGTLNGWQRGGDATAGALDGTGNRQMNAVTALSISGGAGFVAVGSHGDQPSAWTSANGGRTWRQADLPMPVGSTWATLEHVASAGRVVVAVGTAVTTAGRAVPFAASSADGGASWAESALPVPAGLSSVTALVAAGGTFTATGSYGSTPGHQNVVVWTSADGSAWRAAEPGGQGLTGPGIQAITGLAVAGSTLTGVGFTASPAGEQPVFWQAPVR
ncbi:MAG: WD40/YVTN/BNR-like repeat-containing protein, partial [Streptosporangiaceae bacterium]